MPHNINSIDTITKIDGILIRASNAGFVFVNTYETSGYRLEVKATVNDIAYQNNGYLGQLIVILEYTKTTD